MTAPTNTRSRPRTQLAGLIAGPLLATLLLLVLPHTYTDEAGRAVVFTFAGRATLSLMIWMGTWWLTEAISISATALLPIVVLPIVTAGAYTAPLEGVKAATAPYAHHYIFLFMGGFMLALTMERWGLHRRIALHSLRFVGTRPRAIVAAFMAISATFSMWVSNTATTVMMLPIAMSVLALVGDDDRYAPGDRLNFRLCLLLGVAYAASIGGIGTLIGTPPNLFMAGFIEETYGHQIGFGTWLLVGVPLVVVFVPFAWWLLSGVVYPLRLPPVSGGRALIVDEIHRLGPTGRGEWATFVVFMLTALAWILRSWITKIEIAGHTPLAGLSDAGIAMIAALALFVIPVDLQRGVFVLDWSTAKRLPWGILILFGGGLSLAEAVKTHGVAEFIGAQTQALAGLPTIVIVVCVVAGMIFLTELTSNTATTSTLLPILAGMAPAIGVDWVLVIVPAAIAASCAFMMPVATPPNAIVFGAGGITIPQMCRAGLWLNLVGIALVTLLAYAVVVPMLGHL